MREVAVIVPVHGGLRHVRACLRSLMAYPQETPHVVVIIDDASPETAVEEFLEEFARRNPTIRHLQNRENLGFVRTVNRGMALYPQHDVVILNSDTEVANDWLDRLRRCAYERADVATVTPFSNNATICSFPRFCKDNPLPYGCTTAELDRLFAELNDGESVPLPTGVGFCMYIRRDALLQLGPFDETTFGRGYGEENDFCMRAVGAGWQHRLCADTFVYHLGGVSFGAEKTRREEAALSSLQKRYPEYPALIAEHIRRDPARLLRLKVALEAVRRSRRQVVLFITHNLGGGTERHVEDLASFLADRLEPIVLRPTNGRSAMLRLGWQNTGDGFSFNLPEDGSALVDWCRYLGVVRVHFHHTMGVHPCLWGLPNRLEVPYDVTLHDYYLVNANPTLTDVNGRFCSENSGRDAACAQAYPVPGGIDAENWRGYQWPLLENAERVFAPSQATAELYTKSFPRLEPVVVAHPDSEAADTHPNPKLEPLTESEPLSVLVLGALSREKGADVLEATALACQRLEIAVRFKVIGYAYRRLDSTIQVRGPYRDFDLPRLIATTRHHVVWFPAQWPETYSYTLSAALRSRSPLVVPDIGAFPERTAGRPLTWLEPWNQEPEYWAHLFARLREQLLALQNQGEDFAWTRPASEVTPFSYATQYVAVSDGRMQQSVFDLERLTVMLQRGAVGPGAGATALSRRERILVKLIELRSRRLVAAALRWVPFGVQRRFKRWLSDRPIHEIVPD